MSEIYIDSLDKQRYIKTFEGESASDILLSRPSSGLRILFNTTLTSVGSALWAYSWQNYKKLPAGFVASYSKAAILYSLGYFCANEAAHGVLHNQFQLNNFFVGNLLAFALSLSVVTLRKKSYFGQNRLAGAKHGLHIFVYSVYWDLSACYIRNALLMKTSGEEEGIFAGEALPSTPLSRNVQPGNTS